MDPRIERLLQQLRQEKRDTEDDINRFRREWPDQGLCFPWQKLHPHAPSAPRVANRIDNLVVIVSETGIILSVNHTLERMVGRSDLLGSAIWELFTQPHTADTLRARLQTFFDHGTRQQFELTLTSSDGYHHAILWSLDCWSCDEQQIRLVVMAGVELPQPLK
jgi:PAS domain S-box-containing protein